MGNSGIDESIVRFVRITKNLLERGYMLDRQKECIALAKAQGTYRCKPKKQIDQRLWDELYVKWKNGEITAVEFMKRVGLRKSVVYERLKDYGR